jgi:hypothetical protein
MSCLVPPRCLGGPPRGGFPRALPPCCWPLSLARTAIGRSTPSIGSATALVAPRSTPFGPTRRRPLGVGPHGRERISTERLDLAG